MNNLKDILDQSKQSIDSYKSEHPNGTLAMRFQKKCGGIKYICPVWIWTIDSFLKNSRKVFRINERLSDQCKKKTGQQSMTKR